MAAIILLGIFGLSLVVVYGGRDSGLSLRPMITLWRYAEVYPSAAIEPVVGPSSLVAAIGLIAVVWTVTILSRVWGIVLVLPRWRTADPGQVLLIGALAVGVGAFLLFDHPGGSQVYFLISAFSLGVLASAWAICAHSARLGAPAVAAVIVSTGVLSLIGWRLTVAIAAARPTGDLAQQLTTLTRPALFLIVAAAVLVLVAILLTRALRGPTGSLVAVITPVVTIVVIAAGLPTTLEYTVPSRAATGVARTRALKPPTSAAVTRDGVTAARWLRDHSSRDTVIATNRHCLEGQTFPGTTPPPTRRWRLQLPAPAVLEPAAASSQSRIFSSPSVAEAAVLCDHGATYAFLDRRFQPSLPSLRPIADEVFANADVEIYRLRC